MHHNVNVFSSKISLLEIASKEFEDHNFKLIKTKDHFIKKINNISYIYWIVFYNDPDGIRVTPAVAIRFNHVEDIFHLSSGFSKKHQKETQTIVSEIWRWQRERERYQYKITSEEDIGIVGENIISDFKREAQIYFREYSSLASVDSLLNDKPDESSVHQIMDYARCSRGVIIAKICHRQNYTDLVSIYRERMKRQDKGFYLDSFDQLLENLRNY